MRVVVLAFYALPQFIVQRKNGLTSGSFKNHGEKSMQNCGYSRPNHSQSETNGEKKMLEIAFMN
jgi:hypothetical protein